MQLSNALRLAAAMTVAGCMSLYGQFHLGKDKDKSEVLREKELKRDEKNLRMYDKIKAYSQDKYDSDPDFRDRVDDAFRDLLREHMAEAFDHNTKEPRSRIVTVHEDRFRQHEGLYDNLLVQDEINRLGQSLVPANSDRVFAFKLVPDPTPMARTLSTGTIYISTGMVSLLDSQAQLAYVLAHEMAHVQLDHWKELVMMQQGLEAYNTDQTKKAEHIAAIGALAGAVTGGIASKSVWGSFAGGTLGYVGGGIAGAIAYRHAAVEWDKAQEDAADKLAFKAILDSRYDVREVPKLYQSMEAVSSRDSRMTLGFLGERSRIHERQEHADKLLRETYKAEIEAGLKKGFIGDTATHRNLMAELKRDNGIMAYYNDMFEVARRNLGDAVSIRDNDPEAEYFYGKTLETIGRSADDHRLAVECFQKAAKFDTRRRDFGSHLHYALALMQDDARFDANRIAAELDNYLSAWFQYLPEERKAEFLPPSLDSIYDYMAVYSAVQWQPKFPADLQAMQVDFTTPMRKPENALMIPAADALKSTAKPPANRNSQPQRGALPKSSSPLLNSTLQNAISNQNATAGQSPNR